MRVRRRRALRRGVAVILPAVDEGRNKEPPIAPPPVFDRSTFRLLVAALAVGALAIPVLMSWRGFSWLMALSSAAGIATLIFFAGRAARRLSFEWRRPPFAREE